jgi:hypothetical protein
MPSTTAELSGRAATELESAGPVNSTPALRDSSASRPASSTRNVAA